MKKILIVLLALVLVLCAACTPKTPAPTEASTEPTQASDPTEGSSEPEPTETDPPVPNTQSLAVKAQDVPAVLAILNRDDTVEVVSQGEEGYLIVKFGELYGLVEERFLRTADQEPFKTWTGYAVHNAGIFDDLYLQGKAVKKLSMNTKVEVLENFKDMLLIRYKEELYYTKPGSISKSYIQPATGGSSGGADGGDIQLGAFVQTLSAVPQEGEVTGQATVLADGVELVLCYLDMGSTVSQVTEEGFCPAWEGYHSLYFDGLYAYIRQELTALPEEAAYTSWKGYANLNAKVFDNYYLLGSAASKPALNTRLTVIGELDNCYIVQLKEDIGYIAKKLVSKDAVYVGGGGGGDEWSPPVM